MGYSGVRGKLIYEKYLKLKISCQTPFNIFGFNFLDLLINLMKMMLLYIICTALPPAREDQWNDGQGLKDPCFLVLNQHEWDGQGLKESCFFGTSCRITKS
jgi:hypothetical protein